MQKLCMCVCVYNRSGMCVYIYINIELLNFKSTYKSLTLYHTQRNISNLIINFNK